VAERQGIGHVPADVRDDEAAAVGFTWTSLLDAHAEAGRPYLELLRRDTLSAGLYVLPAGGTDLQQPHAEDEVYIVAAGGALFTADDQTREVRAGDVLFVAAGVPHRFHDISEELRLIVVFAPPEGSLSGGDGVADGRDARDP
jgi:mannose-6-phosphate isomerase-like protein (cupin superfamily)